MATLKRIGLSLLVFCASFCSIAAAAQADGGTGGPEHIPWEWLASTVSGGLAIALFAWGKSINRAVQDLYGKHNSHEKRLTELEVNHRINHPGQKVGGE